MNAKAHTPSPAEIAAVQGHPALVRLLQMAYSGEKAAALAYIGHAGSVKDPAEKRAIKEIEDDEWGHRSEVRAIMDAYGIAPSRWFEIRFTAIGRSVALGCYLIGWFMPYYFAGRLESGNVCEYFIMQQYFHDLDISAHDEVLYEMGMKEKEHEEFFLAAIRNRKLLRFFQRVFGWGAGASYNDVDLSDPHEPSMSSAYCRTEILERKATTADRTSRRLKKIQPSA